MQLIDKQGRAVNTGDIVWYGGQSCVFLSFDGSSVEVQTTCDRRYFMRLTPQHLNLEATSDTEHHRSGIQM